MEFSGPSGSAVASDTVKTGYPHVLGIVAQEALPPAGATPETAAADWLSRALLTYIDNWNRDEKILADLFDVSLARPLPTYAAIGGMLHVDALAGVPFSVEWQGLFLDASLRQTVAVPRHDYNLERPKGFFALSALAGSVFEHRLFEEEFGVTGISTARLLGLVHQAGQPLLTLNADNAADLMPTLALGPEVAADISGAVSQGMVVRVPSSPVSFMNWRGIGYLKERPQTAEAGYMLSGGLAGGQTVLGRRDWPAEIAAILAEPFSGPPNDDPAQAVSITAVVPPQVSLATAGEELADDLMVLVRDAVGVPVVAAPVIFRVRNGGGWLIDESRPGELCAELTATSGRDGIARARFVPGEQTSTNPVVYVRDGDRHANLVGENLIDARLESGSQAALAAPIAIFGFAGLPDPARTAAYGDNLKGEAFSYSGDALLILRDRFGNPVANHQVTFHTQAVQPAVTSRCQNPPGLTDGQRNAQLVVDDACLQRSPVHGECDAADVATVISRTDGGARAGIVLGGVPFARYPVSAVFDSISGRAGAAWRHQSQAVASCVATGAVPENRLVLSYQQRRDEAGHNVDARPAASTADIIIKAYLLAEGEALLSGGQTLPCSPLPDRTCNTIAGSGTFTVGPSYRPLIADNPAGRAATMTGSQALPHLYKAAVALPLGLAEIPVEVSASVQQHRINNSCTSCGIEEAVALAVGPEHRTLSIWGVGLRLPDTVAALVNARGIAQHDLTFAFAIEPAQYVANYAQVLLWRNGELWDILPAGTSGSASVVFPAGYWFDPAASYQLEVLLNNAGETNAIHSRRIPLLRRTAAVDLQVDELPAAVENQAGAFVLLNNDFDERDTDPAVTLPDAATPGMVETDDELKRVWLQIDDSSGQGGSWQVRAGNPEKLHIFHQKDGHWVEFAPTDPPEPVTIFPAIIPLYLEGLAESAALTGDTLTATFFPVGGTALSDVVPVTILKLDLALDGNRDRKITFDDSLDEAALFWINDDHDVLGTKDGQPVEDDSEVGDDGLDAQISCKRDLEDFARLHLLLGNLGVSGSLTYTLRMAADDREVQPMLNVFPAINESDGYLGLPSEKATPDQPEMQLMTRLMVAVGSFPVSLPADSLDPNKTNYLLFEGRMPGKGRLVLTAQYQGVPVASRSVALELVNPTWFYDHFIVEQTEAKEVAPVRPAVNPEGMEENASRLGLYAPPSNEYLLFVHGWNMQGWEKKRWAETIFKRLWWQGYRGKVGLFDWPCRTLPSWDFLVNFDRSEFLAWQSAKALAGVLTQLQAEHAGQIRLLAHSQGNVVAGEAIRRGDSGLVQTYVASQAALSAGYYDHIFQTVQDFTPKTPEVLASYPDGQDQLPYLYRVAGKVGRLFNYYNVSDYALTGDSVLQPTWLLNNRTRPDGSLGYGLPGWRCKLSAGRTGHRVLPHRQRQRRGGRASATGISRIPVRDLLFLCPVQGLCPRGRRVCSLWP